MLGTSLESRKEHQNAMSFGELVSLEFSQRKARVPGYSLRRFARALSVDASFLSKLLSGKRPFNPGLIRRIGAVLGMPKEELAKYTSDDSLWGLKQPRRRRFTTHVRFQALRVSDLSDIGEWYHSAILSLAQIDSFTMQPAEISERLGISLPVVVDALHALVNKRLLVRNALGRLTYPTNRTTVHYAYSNETLKRLQKSYLRGAIRAMDNVPLEERDQTAVTMAIDRKDIPKAKEKIREFRRELMQMMESAPSRSDIYQLSVSLFPIKECGE